ncbi:hypothetical protein PanWU01x14_131070 [Parasponia andersonii]|uniref:PHD-type zinc finger plants domain-containing protein n=1 Tax=Parasponia andersonii TaxID=3476 RepID=A0A2P5CR07_PARAD|nr:hypothetical protein PanWU01x14_131070 [Parasponia andersonii]
MTTSKTANTTSSLAAHECCMCGDYGFSCELFQCKVCQFRSQHRYCSNLYPNIPESYRTCNWCLCLTNNKDQDKSQNSSNSSSSGRNDVVLQDDKIKIKTTNKSNLINNNDPTNNPSQVDVGVGALILRRQINGLQQLGRTASSGPIKKQRSVEIVLPSPTAKSPPQPSKSPSAAAAIRKRVLTNGTKEERLKRTRSEEISKNATAATANAPGGINNINITKHVFRNKVRRYKLLDEVSS